MGWSWWCLRNSTHSCCPSKRDSASGQGSCTREHPVVVRVNRSRIELYCFVNTTRRKTYLPRTVFPCTATQHMIHTFQAPSKDKVHVGATTRSSKIVGCNPSSPPKSRLVTPITCAQRPVTLQVRLASNEVTVSGACDATPGAKLLTVSLPKPLGITLEGTWVSLPTCYASFAQQQRTCTTEQGDRIVVADVAPGSPAAASGVQPGDVIQGVTAQPVVCSGVLGGERVCCLLCAHINTTPSTRPRTHQGVWCW